MLDVRNRALAEVAQPDDFIVSDKLISLLLVADLREQAPRRGLQGPARSRRLGDLPQADHQLRRPRPAASISTPSSKPPPTAAKRPSATASSPTRTSPTGLWRGDQSRQDGHGHLRRRRTSWWCWRRINATSATNCAVRRVSFFFATFAPLRSIPSSLQEIGTEDRKGRKAAGRRMKRRAAGHRIEGRSKRVVPQPR